MTVENSRYDATEFRRARVADLRLRGLTLHEISNALASQGIFNRKTHKAWSHSTIANDLKVLKGRWRSSADESTDEHLSRQLAELTQIKKTAWAKSNPDLALRALQLEAKLLGTFAPTKVEFTGSITVEYVQRLITEIQRAGLDPDAVFNRIMSKVSHVNRAELS